MTATALINARLVDGTGAPARNGWGLVIDEEGQISAAGAADSLQIGRETEVLDVSGRTVMPGLISRLTLMAREVLPELTLTMAR